MELKQKRNMASRRDFLGRAAALVALGVAADQIELIERLMWRRTAFAGWSAPTLAYKLQLLNSFFADYSVTGRNWRFDPEGFALGARLTGRDVRYDLVHDVYFVSESVQPFRLHQPRQVLPDSDRNFGPIVAGERSERSEPDP